MRMMRSKGHFVAHVALEPPTGERVIRIAVGDAVDFDEVVRPARPGREALTLGHAFVGREDDFEPVDPPVESPAIPAEE